MEMTKVSDIKVDKPFTELFEIDSENLKAIQQHMSEFGYDTSQPLIIWKEKGILVDGHTRFQAVQNLLLKPQLLRTRKGEFQSLPVVERSFESEKDAIEYAIHNQTERRNLTDKDILKLVEKLDELSDNWGGSREFGRRKDLSDNGEEPSFGNQKLDSRERTANIIGISKDKVSQCRHILENCDDKSIKAIYRGDSTIYQVYSASTSIRREKKIAEQKAITAKISMKPFNLGDTKKELRESEKNTAHLDTLCLRLLSELLKKDSIIEQIKNEVLYFKKGGEKTFKGLTEQKYIQEFLGSPFVDDFITILEVFGFEVKRPDNVVFAKRPEKIIKKRRHTGFDINKVHEIGFVSKAERKEREERRADLANNDPD